MQKLVLTFTRVIIQLNQTKVNKILKIYLICIDMTIHVQYLVYVCSSECINIMYT